MNNINNYKQFIQHVKLNREIKFNKEEYTVFKPKKNSSQSLFYFSFSISILSQTLTRLLYKVVVQSFEKDCRLTGAFPDQRHLQFVVVRVACAIYWRVVKGTSQVTPDSQGVFQKAERLLSWFPKTRTQLCPGC